jgi:hypothetical protein
MIFSLVYNKLTPLISRASVSQTPQDVMISNISDTTFSVSWITQEATNGIIAVEEVGGTKYTSFDDRDQVPASPSEKPKIGTYTTHMVTVRGAKPSTTYRVRLIVNGKSFQNGNTPYEIKTGTAISEQASTIEPAFGTITLSNEQAAEGAIVYLTPEGGQLLSTLVTASGSWVIPLHHARTADLQTYLPTTERLDENITAQTAQGDASALTDTLNDNPVPAMVIGKQYDFRKIQAQTTTSQQLAANTAPTVLGESTQAPPTGMVTFAQPTEGAALATNLPLIAGTGIPGQSVLLIIGMSDPYTDSVLINADGTWKYTPKKTMNPGKQSITMTTVDAQNKSVAMTHMFEILKSGTQVLGDATPSATLIPTPTIVATSSDSSTLAGQPIPTTGSPIPLYLLLVLGVGLLTGGFVLLR